MIQFRDQSNLWKKGFCWAMISGESILEREGSMASAVWARSWANTSPTTHTESTESKGTKRGVGRGCELQSPCPVTHFHSRTSLNGHRHQETKNSNIWTFVGGSSDSNHYRDQETFFKGATRWENHKKFRLCNHLGQSKSLPAIALVAYTEKNK